MPKQLIVCRCRAGKTICQDKCVDLLITDTHCGTCDLKCKETQQCKEGVCIDKKGRSLVTISQPYAMVTALIPKTMQNTAANVEMSVTMVRYASQENALTSAKTVTCFAMEYASKYSTMTNTAANVTKRAQQALYAKVEDVFVQPSNPSATAPALISRTMMNIAVNVMYVVTKGAYAMVAHASAMKESHTAKIHVSIQTSISNTADNATKHAQANTLAKKAYADPHVRHLNSIAMGLVSTPH